MACSDAGAFVARYENGRRYHAYHAGEYPLPNDEKEQDRLDMQHHLYSLLYDGDIYRAPISKDIKYALDVGCGTGIVRFGRNQSSIS